MNPWLGAVRRIHLGEEGPLARRLIAREQKRGSPEERRFEEELLRSPGAEDLVVGRARRRSGSWAWVCVPYERLVRGHATIGGGSGSGKSRWVTAVVTQLLCRRSAILGLFDAKSETATDLIETVLPYVAAVTGDEGIIERLRIIRPFSSSVPPLNVTVAEAGIPKEAQAYAITESIEQALREPLGPRMHHVVLRLVTACIDLGMPLPTLQKWLLDPRSYLQVALRSDDPEVREYARTGFPRESPESLRATAARLNAFLFLPETRRALNAPSCISFDDALREPGGIFVVDVGSPPAGSESLQRFWASLILGKLVRALLSRSWDPGLPPVLLVAEEIQEILGPNEAQSLARLLSVARFRGIALWLTNQSRSQILRVDRNLVEAIAANAAFHVQFRSSYEDARAFAHLLPLEGKGALTGTAVRRQLVEELTRLPRRHCYLALRDAPFAARRILTPRLELEALKDAAANLSPEVRERIRGGAWSIDEPVIQPTPTVHELALPNAADPLEEEADEASDFPSLG